MYLKFNEVEIYGFQSIGEKSVINLSNRGVVLIKGINNYEMNATSNGSGKSSIFESILWCIYGKTSSGTADPSNKYFNNGCYVKVKFMVDGQNYTIIRSCSHSKFKTGLILYKDEEDISGRNKTDTDKIIRNDILKMSQEIFLSTIFLSQGFSSRISSLQPSGRKERIEILTENAEQIEEFKESVSKIKNDFSAEYHKILELISYKSGTIDSLTNSYDSLKEKLDKKNKETENFEDLGVLTSKMDSLNKLLATLDAKTWECHSNISVINGKMNNLKSEKNNNISQMSYKENDMLKISNNKCPTCGQELEDSKTLLESSKECIDKLKDRNEIIDSSVIAYSSELKKHQDMLDTMNDKIYNLKSKINDLSVVINRLNYYKTTDEDNQVINEYPDKISVLNNEVSVLKTDSSAKEIKSEVAQNCVSLITKQFRGYLLQNIVLFMNSKLVSYSNALFSNEDDVISLAVDSSKLEIFLNDQNYGTLSGGEKRKVDLALVLAQRDLSINIAGSTSNLLIMDEIYDNLDEDGVTVVTNMFSNVSSEIDSMFIISHKPNVEIPYDSTITVVKNNKRISEIIDVFK